MPQTMQPRGVFYFDLPPRLSNVYLLISDEGEGEEYDDGGSGKQGRSDKDDNHVNSHGNNDNENDSWR